MSKSLQARNFRSLVADIEGRSEGNGTLHAYRAFGLTIRSDFPLPGYERVRNDNMQEERDAASDLLVLNRRIDPAEIDALDEGGARLAGHAKGLFVYCALHGSKLIVCPDRDVDVRYLRSVIGGELIAIALRQRGLLPLHASCIARDGRAIAFVGASGWGKSTTALYFTQHDYDLIGDDITVVDVNGPVPQVRPGPSHVKLETASIRALFGRKDVSSSRAHGRTKKRLLHDATSRARGSHELAAIYLLEGEGRSETRVVPLPARQQLIELLRHTRGSRIEWNVAFKKNHLAQCERVVKRVPMRLLRRTFELGQLDEIRTSVEAT